MRTTAITSKTADLTIIDTLHETGEPQQVITEKAGCSMSDVSKHIDVDWRRKLRYDPLIQEYYDTKHNHQVATDFFYRPTCMIKPLVCGD